MTERRSDPDVLHSIDTRLTVVERDLERLSNMRRILIGFLGLFIVQITSFIYGYAQLQQKVEGINLQELEKNISIALTVVADHGTELETIRGEQARIRGNIDQLHQYMENLRRKVDQQTSSRFYKEDGDRLEQRVNRIENRLLE